MNKKIIISLLLALTMGFSGFFLAACGGNGGNGGDNGGAGTEDPGGNNGGNNGGGNEQPSAPEKKAASDYFSGARLSYVNNAITDTALGGTKDFNTLLERQIDAVAQELLVRLGKVYGSMDANVYQIKNGNQDFTGLTVTKNNVIIEPSRISTETGNPIYDRKAGGTVNVYDGKIDLDDAATYAFLLSTGGYEANLNGTGVFNFRNAIQGGYVYYENQFTDNYRDNKSWNMSYFGDFNLNNYIETYISDVKMGIANAIADTNTSYTEAKKAITHLGFNSQSISNIISFVKNEIIGESVITRDNNQKPTQNTISSSTELTSMQHEFKNYEVIIPAIVNSIANQKVQPSGNAAYFAAEKDTVNENASLTDSHSSYAEYKSIALKVKNNGTQVTKLEIKTHTNYTGTYSYKVIAKINSTSKNVTPANGLYMSNNELTFVLDLASEFPSVSLSKDSVIELTFEPISSTTVPFRVEFTGYWNKNA